jgi:Cytochrome C oxidase, cbb3-type, subunit III
VRKIITGLLTVVVIAGLGAFARKACAEDQPAPAATDDKSSGGGAAAGGESGGGAAAGEDKSSSGGEAAGGACCKAGDATPPLDLVKNTPKGGLHNPYNDQIDQIAEEGHKKYLSFSCNGCHGGGGGGGMCPPLTNQTWVYGPDDDTLFRLVALGTDELKKQGYTRHGQEMVVGPMPPFGGIIKTSDDLWKVIAWVRSVNPDSKAKVDKPVQ